MSAKRILVTGGCGFIGSGVVRRLVADGHRVRVLDDLSRGETRRLADIVNDFEFMQGDVRDPDVVYRAVRDIDAIHHLTFINGTQYFYTHPELVLDVGVRGIVNVIDAALKRDVGEFLLVSSSEVYQTPPTFPTPEEVPFSIPDPFNPRYSYAAGKIISEIMAINYGRSRFAQMLIIRPHNVYGPDMGAEHVVPQFALRMASLAREQSGTIDFPIQGTGRETRAFIYIDDFVEGVIKVAQSGEKLAVYNVGTSQEHAISELALLVAKCYGRPIRIVPGATALGETPRRCPDIRKLERLGFRARVSLEEGVRRTTEWYWRNADAGAKPLRTTA
jgi:nucleoside-diphosphate-sugar epimerase